MFFNALDSAGHPLASRSRGILIGSVILIAAAGALVSARTVAATFWALVASFLISTLFRRDVALAQLRPGPVAMSLGAFGLYAMLSASWAAVPQLPLEKGGLALLVGACTLLIAALINTETRPNLIHMGEGLYIGLLIGVVYLLAEILTDQAIKLSLYRALQLRPGDLLPPSFFSWDGNYLLAISTEDLTRNMTDAALFLWPAIMAVEGVWRRPWCRIAAGALLVLTAVTVMSSNHASSKLALVTGIVVFALAWLSLRWTKRAVIVAWLMLCLAVVPLALLAHRIDMQDAGWLEDSAKHRIIIWNYTAEKTLDAPILGVGANMTYLIGPELERHRPPSPPHELGRTLSIHSHCVYLQTWFELGVIGALLLTAFGLSVIAAIGRLAARTQPYAYATFASSAAMAAVSYGMWQAWFITSFALTAVLCVLGTRCLARDDGLSNPAPVGAGS